MPRRAPAACHEHSNRGSGKRLAWTSPNSAAEAWFAVSCEWPSSCVKRTEELIFVYPPPLIVCQRTSTPFRCGPWLSIPHFRVRRVMMPSAVGWPLSRPHGLASPHEPKAKPDNPIDRPLLASRDNNRWAVMIADRPPPEARQSPVSLSLSHARLHPSELTVARRRHRRLPAWAALRTRQSAICVRSCFRAELLRRLARPTA